MCTQNKNNINKEDHAQKKHTINKNTSDNKAIISTCVNQNKASPRVNKVNV